MSAPAASQNLLHIHWHTHSGYPQLRGETERFVHNFIADRCIHTPGVMFEAIGGTDDHVHLALRAEPQVQISDLVGKLKSDSSFEANVRFGTNAIQWRRGFGVVRFDEKQLGWVLSYIRNQREHHARGKVFSKLEDPPKDSGDARRVQESSGLFAHVEDDVAIVPVLDESDIQPAQSAEAIERAQAAAVFQEAQAQSTHAAPVSSDDPAYALQVRAKDLLALAEKDRRSAEIAFADLGFEKQLDTALALQGDELHEWLQLAEDFTELVRALPPEHLHQAVRLIGDEDALNLLQAASSEQMQQMTDIEWFTEGRLDRKKVRHWLNLLMTLDEEEADQAMQGLDVNALAQYLRPSVRFAVDKDNLLLALHLNQRYLFTPDDIDPRDDFTRNLLDYFYAVDRDLFGDVIALLVGEDAETVENDMYGGREDRLIKRGFPAQSQAEFLLELVNASNYGIEWPKLETPVSAGGSNSGEITAAGAGAMQSTNRARTPFLLTALAWGRATKVLGERTEREFIKESADLANSLLLAHTKDSGKPELRSSSLLAVQVLTSVALEALTGPLFLRGSDTQMSVAADKLKMMELRELFQIGWSMTREVARDAWALAFDERIDELRLPRNLKWLPPGLRKDLRDAEDLMSWKRVAATASETAPPAGDDDKNPSQELLTWPRLCRLRHSVWLAQNELARRFSEKNGESDPVHE